MKPDFKLIATNLVNELFSLQIEEAAKYGANYEWQINQIALKLEEIYYIGNSNIKFNENSHRYKY